MKKNIVILQTFLYILSPFVALFLTSLTNAVNDFFIIMVLLINFSQWLAIYNLKNL